MPLQPYVGDQYLDMNAVTAWCQQAAAQMPRWARCETIGHTRGGRPITLLTITDQPGSAPERPGFWLDGGTHAAEFTGTMSAVYSASRWLSLLESGDEAATAWFSRHAVYVVP